MFSAKQQIEVKIILVVKISQLIIEEKRLRFVELEIFLLKDKR
jgi:hypothetical protein